MIPCNPQLVSFFFKSLNKPFKDHSKQTTIINLEEIFSEFSVVFTCFSVLNHVLFQSIFSELLLKHVFNLQFNVLDQSSAYLSTLSIGGIKENSTSRSKDLEKGLAEESSSVKISVTLPTKYGVSGSKIKAQRLVSIIQYFPQYISQPGKASFFCLFF